MKQQKDERIMANCQTQMIKHTPLFKMISLTNSSDKKYVKNLNENNNMTYALIDHSNLRFLMDEGIELKDNCVLHLRSLSQNLESEMHVELMSELSSQSYQCIVITMGYDKQQVFQILESISQNQNNLIKLEVEIKRSNQEYTTSDLLHFFSILYLYYKSSPKLKLLKCSLEHSMLILNESFSSFYFNLVFLKQSELNTEEQIDIQLKNLAVVLSNPNKYNYRNICINLTNEVSSQRIVSDIMQLISCNRETLQKVEIQMSSIEDDSLQLISSLLTKNKNNKSFPLLNSIVLQQKEQISVGQQLIYSDMIIKNWNSLTLNVNKILVEDGIIEVSLQDQESIKQQVFIVEQVISSIEQIRIINLKGNSTFIEIFIQSLNTKIAKRISFKLIFTKSTSNPSSLINVILSKNIFKFQFMNIPLLFLQNFDQIERIGDYSSEIDKQIIALSFLKKEIQFFLYFKYSAYLLDLLY